MRKKILVVDDNVEFVRLLQLHLSKLDYLIETAFDGRSALDKIEGFQPDLIVLDVTMPKMDGFEFIRSIMTDYDHLRFSVLVVTARAELKEVFESLDVDGFLSKPFEISYFIKEVERLFSKPKSKFDIFIIDQKDKLQCKSVVRALKREHYQVSVTSNIDGFMKLLNYFIPDLVLIEYVQVECPGDALILQVRQMLLEKAANWKIGYETPIVAYTFSGMDYKQKAIEAGAKHFIENPSSVHDFLSVIRQFELKKKGNI